MEIKVKDIGLQEEKSKAEIEQELLEKHEEKFEVQDSSKEKVEVENNLDTEDRADE